MGYQNMLLQQGLPMNLRTIWMIFFLKFFLIIEHCIDKVLQALPSFLYFNNNNNNNNNNNTEGCSPLVKDRDTLIEQLVANSNKRGAQNNSQTSSLWQI